jgi:hypothetical protein
LNLRGVLENNLRSFFGCDGRSDYAVNFMFCDKAVECCEEVIEAFGIVLADLESGIHENIGHVVVACKNTCDETVKRLRVLNAVFFGVDQTAAIIDIELQLVALFDAYYCAVGVVESFVDQIDESLGLTGTFFAYD